MINLEFFMKTASRYPLIIRLILLIRLFELHENISSKLLKVKWIACVGHSHVNSCHLFLDILASQCHHDLIYDM